MDIHRELPQLRGIEIAITDAITKCEELTNCLEKDIAILKLKEAKHWINDRNQELTNILYK